MNFISNIWNSGINFKNRDGLEGDGENIKVKNKGDVLVGSSSEIEKNYSGENDNSNLEDGNTQKNESELTPIYHENVNANNDASAIQQKKEAAQLANERSVKKNVNSSEIQHDSCVSADTKQESDVGNTRKNLIEYTKSVGVDVEEVSQKAIESAKLLGNFLFSVANKAGKTVTETAKHLKHTVEDKSILGDFNKEQEAFLRNKSSGSCDTPVAPWVGYVDEETVKQQILSLSKDKRNFMRNPPTGVQFQFNVDSIYPVASIMLEEDPELRKMRFELVPKFVSEENFWRNYFYRVSLVKQSTQLTSMTQEESGSTVYSAALSPEDKKKVQALREEEEVVADSPTHEFVSDAYEGSHVSEEDIKEGMRQLGVEGKLEQPSNEEDWEKELQQELCEYEVVTDGRNVEDDAEWDEEIQQMLKAENLEDKK
ncbi:synapse-associated protein 1-like isoform X2 [Tachypleus tridentatus]|uniref:synapse-associated protein 1-like isoform X2 n=1 Tax=Tachypleus tridentatus TaxID=6853 RepID=UPI003FCFE9DF